MVTLVQEGHAYAAGLGGAGASVTLGATPTSGNLLVAVVSNGGTSALTTNPFGAAPDVTSTDASITTIHSKVAGASESATVTAIATTGTGDLHVYEFAPSAGKTWGSSRLGPTQVANSSTTTVTTQTTGTTATATADGVAVGGIAANGLAGTTASATNSYVVHTPTASGRGRAAYKFLTSAAAQETTLGTMGTARRVTGAIATYQHEATSTVTGTLSASVPVAKASISGTATPPTYTGAIAAAVVVATASMTGTVTPPTYTGNIAASTPVAVASISGTATAPSYTGTVAAAVPLARAAVAGVVTAPTYSGSLAASALVVVGSLSGTVTAPTFTGTLAATTPLATAAIAGTYTSAGPTVALRLTARRLPASASRRLPETTARRLPATLTARRLP